MKAWLEGRWYSSVPPPVLLRPLAALYGHVAASRRRAHSAAAVRLPVPVIVVGNIAVGGTGKTPFTIWLIERLRDWGWRPGVVARGYGGRAPYYPFHVSADSKVSHVGDEPLMMQRRLSCPMVIAPDRVAAARALLDEAEVDVIVADDGLQHYRLARDREFCVIDGRRRYGNGALLPAGPLRELPRRLREVSLAVVNGGSWRPQGLPAAGMELVPGLACSLPGGPARPLSDFAGRPVHAVAGIGHPQRFFDMLRAQGLQVLPHAFADHHCYRAHELDFGDTRPVLMTEKDAVKCRAFAREQHWYVPVEARLGEADTAAVRKSIEALRPGAPPHG